MHGNSKAIRNKGMNFFFFLEKNGHACIAWLFLIFLYIYFQGRSIKPVVVYLSKVVVFKGKLCPFNVTKLIIPQQILRFHAFCVLLSLNSEDCWKSIYIASQSQRVAPLIYKIISVRLKCQFRSLLSFDFSLFFYLIVA